MRHPLLRAVAATAVAVLLPTVAAGPATAAPRASRCQAHEEKALTFTSSVVVFATPYDDTGSRRIYACRLPAGPARLLAEQDADDGQYGSDLDLKQLAVAGPYAGVVVTTGAASASQCGKVMLDPCPGISDIIRVVDARSGRLARIDPEADTADSLTLSPAGAAAWIEPGTLVGTAFAPLAVHRLAAAPRVLDTGTAFTGLRFARGTLRWKRDGAARSATLVP